MSESRCRVLCVDDHRDTSEMLQLLLAEEDYEVHTAATVEEACSLAFCQSPKNRTETTPAIRLDDNFNFFARVDYVVYGYCRRR